MASIPIKKPFKQVANEPTSVAQNPSVLQVAAAPLTNDDYSVLESAKDIVSVPIGNGFKALEELNNYEEHDIYGNSIIALGADLIHDND